MKVLCVTHSSRPFEQTCSSLNSIERRFPPGRLQALPPLDSLGSVQAAMPYSGRLTLWRLDDCPRLEFLRAYDPDYKVQSAVFAGDALVVCGFDRVEILDTDFKPRRTVRDNWIAGGHTAFMDAEGSLWCVSAAANAILRVDIERGEVVERIRMPPRYGTGYPVRLTDDLRAHFVPIDLQPAHVNCAVPTPAGVLVTMWIPGAVGLYDADRRYREIVHGLRGCHGGRLTSDGRQLYVTDSSAALIWFFNLDDGRVVRRLRIDDSAWVHDSELIADRLLAVSIADRNEVRLVDLGSGETLFRQDCSPFGESAMFVTCCEVSPAWHTRLGTSNH